MDLDTQGSLLPLPSSQPQPALLNWLPARKPAAKMA